MTAAESTAVRARVLVTGGTGFFGKSLLSRLRRGWLTEVEWVILSRDPRSFLERFPEFAGLRRVSYRCGDVRSFELPPEPFDLIIHAATPAVTTLAPGEMRSIILTGTRRILDYARRCEVEKLLFISSGAVYGQQPPGLEGLPETFPCHPVTEYGQAKLAAERLCLDSGIPALVARCFAFVGPYLERGIHFAVGNFIRDALAGRTISVAGDGTPFRSYLYADDLMDHLAALVRRGRVGEAYNIGSDHAVSIAELADTVRRVLNPELEIKVAARAEPGVAPARYVPDVGKSHRELGVEIRVGLEDAIVYSAKQENKA